MNRFSVEMVMKASKSIQVFSATLLLILINVQIINAQCPTFYNFEGVTSDNPYWYSCNGGNYTLTLQSPDNIGNWEVNWGDGSPVQTGNSLVPPASVTHLYTAAVDTFVVTFTESSSGCVVQGVVVMEEATSASIQIPVGGLTQACAPQEMEFINSSTNVSETTTFIWDFGDGSENLVFDHTNWGQTVTHTYEQNTVDCETQVTLITENYCNTIQGGPSQATFNPIRIWDLDDAAITPSNFVQCYPDTVFTFTNTTDRNCVFQGNIFQRQEYWNFGDYWGTGQDSIIDWTPWPPTFPKTIAYPGLGTYEIMMIDSNFCGQDTAVITVQVVEPAIASFTASTDTICEGETITFFNNSSGNANSFSWYFGTNPWINTGGGNITRTFNNAGTFIVQLVATIDGAAGSCADTASFPVVVLPAPEAVINLDNPVGCDELTVQFSDGSIGAVSTWEWTMPDGQLSSLPVPPVQVLDSPGAYTATLTVSSINGCSSTTHEDVFVYQTPDIGFVPDNVCEGVSSLFTDQSVAAPGDSIISWIWDFGNGDTASGAQASHVFNATGTYTINLEVSTPHCSASQDFEVIVEPVPEAAFSVDLSEGCGPLQVQFTNESSGAFSYTWIFGDGGLSSEESPAHTFINFTGQDLVFEVLLVASTEFGCSDTAMVPVTVFPGAVAQFSSNSLPGCAPFDAEFTNNSQGASSYQWDFGDGAPFSNEVNPIHTYQNQGLLVENFLVELIAFSPNGCNDTTYATVTAYPEANFSFNTLPDSGCSPLSVQFPNILGAIQLDWLYGDGTAGNGQSPTHIYTNDTGSPITYTAQVIGLSPFGCIDTAYSEVLVNPAPVAQFTPGIMSGCSPLNVDFQNFSLNADSYTWDFGDGNVISDNSLALSHVFANTTGDEVTYTVTLSANTEDGCVDETTHEITVYPAVSAQFAMPEGVCAQTQVDFDNLSTGANSFNWDFGNGFIEFAENPAHTFIGLPGDSVTYNVQLIAESQFGCADTAVQSITIHPQPLADFNLDLASGCGPLEVTITDNTLYADTYNWTYGDGQGSDTNAGVHSHVYNNTGTSPATFILNLEVSNYFGCSDQTDQEIGVFPDVIADFEVSEGGCSPYTPEFTNNSEGAVNYTWYYGDGLIGTGENPTHQYENNTDASIDYTIVLETLNQYGCVASDSAVVTVHPQPQVQFAINEISNCAPFLVTFENQSQGAVSFIWDYGTGASSNEDAVMHQYEYFNQTPQSLSFDVTLSGISEHGCENSMTAPVQVLPQLVAAFNSDSIDCSPLQVTFFNQSVGASTYNWFMNGEWFSDENNPSETLYNESEENMEYQVMMIAQSFTGCLDTALATLTVLATPNALFNATPTQQTYPDATVSVNNESTGDNVFYHWDWGNGNTSFGQSPDPITYDTWGTYTITLTVDNGICADQISQDVIIDVPLPVADFEGMESGCQPVTVQFVNTSEFGLQYIWDFGDGQTSAAENPVHTYFVPGTYTVSLTVIGHGGETDVEVKESVIEVYPQAVAFFTANPLNVTVPNNPVNFFNLSTNATDYLWDFGDGNYSQETDPQHYYQSIGTYWVTLIATNEYLCADTFSLADPVIAEGAGTIVFPNAFTPSFSGGEDGYYDITANNYNNDVFFPLHSGVEEYELLIFNRWGEIIFETKEVNRGWNGFYKGELCQQDVYVWKVRARFADGTEIQRAGDVTLIR